MSEQKNQENIIDKEKYKEMTPLLNENFDGKTEKDKRSNGESIIADNDARFNNHTKYSDTQKQAEKKVEKKSRAVRFFEGTENLSWVAPIVNFFEKKISGFFSLFRYTPLFFEKNTYFKIINIILFFAAYIGAVMGFFNGSIILLPIFFILLDFGYYYSHIKFKRKGKAESLILNKHKYFIVITALMLVIYLYLSISNFDWNFKQNSYFMWMLNVITYIYVLCSLYYVTRKHFVATLVGFFVFYTMASQGVFVINWNANWSNEYTTFNHINTLAYTYYTAHNGKNSVIEEVKPQDFFKIQTATDVDFGVFYTDVIYTYKLSNSAIQNIKNAKCLRTPLINCSMDKDAPKYVKDKHSYIERFDDYKIYLKYKLGTLQQDFIDGLKIKVKQPFKESDYDDDIKTLYQIYVNKDNEDNESIKEQLGLSDLDITVESVRLGQTLFDKNKSRSRFK